MEIAKKENISILDREYNSYLENLVNEHNNYCECKADFDSSFGDKKCTSDEMIERKGGKEEIERDIISEKTRKSVIDNIEVAETVDEIPEDAVAVLPQ